MNNLQIAGLILLALVVIFSLLVRRGKIIEVTWHLFPVFWFGRVAAITLYPFIIYKKKPVALALRRHEWIHIDQVRRYGWWHFYLHYIFDRRFMENMEKQAYNFQEKPRSNFK